MTNVLRFLGVAALAVGLAGPVLADEMMDAATMTCANMMAMDSTGMMAAGAAIKAAPDNMASMGSMSDEDVMKAAETACKAHPDMTVMDAMKSNM